MGGERKGWENNILNRKIKCQRTFTYLKKCNYFRVVGVSQQEIKLFCFIYFFFLFFFFRNTVGKAL